MTDKSFPIDDDHRFSSKAMGRKIPFGAMRKICQNRFCDSNMYNRYEVNIAPQKVKICKRKVKNNII